MQETTNPKIIQPLWLKITVASVMFLVVGAVYTIVYGFWVGMSAWADMKPSDADTAERFYLTYIWPVFLLIALIVPTITTMLNIRWLWKWVYWFFGFLLTFLGWVSWFGVIEFTSK